MAWLLCSKQDVINIHPCQDEDLKDQWSEMIEGMIRQHMGTPYLGEEEVISEELHCGDGTSILGVRKPPIVSVSEVKVNTLALTAADYVVFNSYIQLRYETFPTGTLNVSISYTSGGLNISPQVRLCAAAMVVAIVNYNRRMGADASIKWGETERKTGEETPNLNVGLTSHLITIMKRTLRRPKIRAK